MINVLIPQKGTEAFSLYAKGNIVHKTTIDDVGTYIQFDGVVVLTYKYTYHRRSYIVKNNDEVKYHRPIKIPNVKHPVAIIDSVYGRKIDLLRRIIWNLEQMNGKKVYLFPVKYWQSITCLLDNFNGKKSAANKSNFTLLNKILEIRRTNGESI